VERIVRNGGSTAGAHEDPRSREPLLEGYGDINHPDPEGALWLYTLFHRLVMWCGLTRRGDTSDGPAGLLRDLGEMSRSTHEE
jgi:hypothetical protein